MSPEQLQQRFFCELLELRRASRERGFDHALDCELIITNPRFVLQDGSMALRMAEAEEALHLDCEFGAQVEATRTSSDPEQRQGCWPDEQLVEHYLGRMHS